MREGIVCIVGDGAVGKTSVLARLMHRDLSVSYDPTIEDSFTFKETSPDGERIKIDFFDTSGQQEYAPLVDMAIATANIVVVVYDISRIETFDAATRFVKQVFKQRAPTSIPPLLLVCNKQDLSEKMKVPTRVNTLAESKGMEIFWTSAREDTGFTELRNRIMELLPKARNRETNCCCCLTH